MITNSIYNAHKFIYSLAYQGPNETTTYFNDNDGYFRSHLYMFEGSLKAYESVTENPTVLESATKTQLVQNMLYDISTSRGKYITSNTTTIGASMAMFNPVPASRKLNVQILNNTQTIEVNGISKPVTIVCLTGPVQVNGKELKSTQFAVVDGKSVSLVMGENTICALVSEV